MPWKYDPNSTNGAHEIFPMPKPDPADAQRSSAASWPKSSMTTTSVEQVLKGAQVQEQNTANRLAEFGLKDVHVGSYVPSKDGK
jgi:hypothetical protein